MHRIVDSIQGRILFAFGYDLNILRARKEQEIETKENSS